MSTVVTAKVITVSDRSYRGEREDAGGPAVKALLERAGYTVGEICVMGLKVRVRVTRTVK